MNNKNIYLVFTLPLLVLLISRLVWKIDGLYGQDGYEYLRYAKGLKTYLLTGTDPGNFFWPVIYPLAGALLSFVIPDVALALQIISVLSLCFVGILTSKIIYLVYPIKRNMVPVMVAMLTIISPFVLRMGILVMADMFTLALFLAGVYYTLLFIQKNQIFTVLFSAFFFSLAFMCRYAAAVVILPFTLYSCFHFFKTKQKLILIPLIVIVSVLPLVPHFLIKANDPVGFILHNWITGWSPINFIRRSFVTADGFENNSVPNICYAFLGYFHPRYFFPAMLVILIGIKGFHWNSKTKLILSTIILYLIFLSGIPYQNSRFLLLSFPFFMILCYGPIEYLFGIFDKKWSLVLLFPVLILQLILFGMSFKKVVKRTVLERNILQYITDKKIEAIYTMDVDVSLRGRGYDGQIYNIFTEYYQNIDTNAIVIFNAKTFSKQWDGKMPMKNWNHFNEDSELIEIKSFEGGWKAYAFK